MPTLTHGIILIPDFFSEAECAAHIAASEACGYEGATIVSAAGTVRDASVRDNDRVIVDDPDLASELWRRLAPDVPAFLGGRQAWGLNERWRLYRYEPGQSFAPHFDAPYRRGDGEQSMLTLLIYLNDGFEGGETSFEEITVAPERGAALLFRHERMHAGEPLRSGRKYALRSDVMYGPVGMIRG